MGYKVPVRTQEFEFRDGNLKGLVVQFRANIPLDDYFHLVELAAVAAKKGSGLGSIRDLFRETARIGLAGWNLENGEGPMAATPENFTGHLPPADGVRLVNEYLRQIGGLPGPLARPSASGGTSAKRRGSKRRPNSPEPS